MSTVDRILNFLGAACTGAAVAAEAGAPLPSWLKIACTVIAFAAPASASPLLKRDSLKAGKLIPGTTQRIDDEDPR